MSGELSRPLTPETRHPLLRGNILLLESENCLSRRAWIEVDLGTLRDNVRAIRAYSGGEKKVLAVVKANAYGHGMLPVAKAALEAGAAWLGVATVEEGSALREAGINAPVALLCHFAPDEAADVLALGLTPTVGDWDTLQALISASRRTEKKGIVHLEIDTGIGRSGILPHDAVAFGRCAAESGLRVRGLCTHFADPDAEASPFAVAQLEIFESVRASLEAAGARFDWIHVSSSAAILRFPQRGGNLVRPGLLLYGLRPTLNASILLRPALALKARVATVRALPAGHNISYGLTCALQRSSRVATVLIGYGDGYPRRLSNIGHVLLHGKPAPILGRVCMDQTVIDVTEIPEAAAGDIAVCIGQQGAAQISAESLSALIETTEHEITTALSARLPRITIDFD